MTIESSRDDVFLWAITDINITLIPLAYVISQLGFWLLQKTKYVAKNEFMIST